MPIELNKIRIKTFKNTLQKISDAIDSAPNDASVSDIAVSANLSKGTVYRYISFSAILKEKILRKKFEHYKQLLKEQKYLIHRYKMDIENSDRMLEFIRKENGVDTAPPNKKVYSNYNTAMYEAIQKMNIKNINRDVES